MQIAQQNAPTLVKARHEGGEQAASSRPPEIETGSDHEDRPSGPQFQQPAPGRPEGPAAMQGARPSRQPFGRRQRAQHARPVRIDEHRIGQAAVGQQQHGRAAARVARQDDLGDRRAVPLRVRRSRLRQRGRRAPALDDRCAAPVRGAAARAAATCALTGAAGPAARDEPQRRVALVHQPLRPEVERAGRALPQHERDDDQRCQEMPAPEHRVEAAVHQNLTFSPAKTVSGVPCCGGPKPELSAM